MSLRIESPGPLALVQDLGRPGLAHLGVPPSGALDLPAHTLANRLLGNRPMDATIEILLGHLTLTALAPHWLAITGAAGPATAGDRPAPLSAPFLLESGESLVLGAAEYGVRYYVGVRGGVNVHPVLGSRSTDLLSGFGAPLAAGDEIAIGAPLGEPLFEAVPYDVPSRDDVTLTVTLGPRSDWFASPERLFEQRWTVDPASNRVGLRFAGTPLARLRGDELPSEGMVTGALQVPPSGQPILFLADHPVTGGYPVIGVVAAADLHRAAQLRPGQGVRFVGRGR